MSPSEPDAQKDAPVGVVLVTCPDAETGARIARALLEERLIACANLLPQVRSLYRWEGKVEDDPEVLLVLKTGGARVEALTERVCALHPYDVPEVIQLPVTAGHAPYLQWVLEETSA